MICPGDPQDRNEECGLPAESPMEGVLFPDIPVQPLSWSDAEPLLRNLAGQPVPDETWQGGLDFDYHIGPGPSRVHMSTKQNYTNPDLHNVFGEIRGSEKPEEVILIGNHRDGPSFLDHSSCVFLLSPALLRVPLIFTLPM